MAFYIGQKVECVDFELPSDKRIWPGGGYIPNWPRVGAIYTVRSFLLHPTKRGRIRLQEIINPLCRWQECEAAEAGFPSVWFRPLIETKTDISVFTEMLTPKTEKVLAAIEN